MFNVGDRIVFKHSDHPSCVGTVARVDTFGSRVSILMWPDSTNLPFGRPLTLGDREVGGKGTYRFDADNCFHLYEMGPPLPEHIKQQRAIMRKCKVLWNNSNFVKKNPALVY